MKRLIESELYGRSLILVDRPETVARYNECMDRLGLKPTELKKFHVDGIGWSPEIAREKENKNYLSHGPANPLGIIITTNQRGCPIYMPAHSFDRVMLKAYFDQHSDSIANLTVETGIGLDLDQRLSWYETLDDLALIKDVSVSSLTGGLGKAAREQKELVQKFMNAPSDDWMDDELRESIVRSFKDHGGLYDRSLTIPEFEYEGFDDLHTSALGGVYIFRHQGDLALIVVEDEEQKKNASKKLKKHVVTLSGNGLLDRILTEEIAGIDMEWYRENTEELEKRLRTLAMFTLSKSNPDLPLAEMTWPQLRKELRQCPSDDTELYREIERMCSLLREHEDINEMSYEAHLLLLHPIHTSSRYEENLVWRLICQMQEPVADVIRLYAVDKNLFFTAYQSWPESLREWATREVASAYDSSKTYDA